MNARLARALLLATLTSALGACSNGVVSGGDAMDHATDAASDHTASDHATSDGPSSDVPIATDAVDRADHTMVDGGIDVATDTPPADTGPHGPTCDAAGQFCGGHGVTGGDPSTLYYCHGANEAPASQQACANGCTTGSGTTMDACTVTMPSGGSPVCPGGGLWCGEDMVQNGVTGTLYNCPSSGAAPTSSMPCTSGCHTAPLGTNDYCNSSLTCPTSGDYCGSDGVNGDANTLYHCTTAGQAPSSSTPCANGCHTAPPGTPDTCNAGQVCPGVGAYCGGDGVQGGDANTLYNCPGAGMAPSSSMPCSQGCVIQPSGTPDYCATTSTCPGPGAYCGNDGLNGPSNVLYQCPGAGQQPSSSMTCPNGCSVQAAGTPDYCIGSSGSCNSWEQGALNWEAGQLNGGNSWSDYCLGFVATAYRDVGHAQSYLAYYDANDALNAARGQSGWVNWNGSCPCGAILFWSANSCNGEYGHVVICNGDGTVSTSGWPGYGGSTHASISWLDGEECGHTPAGYITPY